MEFRGHSKVCKHQHATHQCKTLQRLLQGRTAPRRPYQRDVNELVCSSVASPLRYYQPNYAHIDSNANLTYCCIHQSTYQPRGLPMICNTCNRGGARSKFTIRDTAGSGHQHHHGGLHTNVCTPPHYPTKFPYDDIIHVGNRYTFGMYPMDERNTSTSRTARRFNRAAAAASRRNRVTVLSPCYKNCASSIYHNYPEETSACGVCNNATELEKTQETHKCKGCAYDGTQGGHEHEEGKTSQQSDVLNDVIFKPSKAAIDKDLETTAAPSYLRNFVSSEPTNDAYTQYGRNRQKLLDYVQELEFMVEFIKFRKHLTEAGNLHCASSARC